MKILAVSERPPHVTGSGVGPSSFEWLALIALLALFAAGAASFALRSAGALRSMDERDYGEGIVLWQAEHVTDLRTAYHPVEDYPHLVFHYPPLYHLASRAVAAFTHNLLVAGRLVSILSFAGTCLVMAALTWVCLPGGRTIAARSIGAFSAGTIVFTLPVWKWACLMRVDSLAMLLVFLGLALYILAWRRPALAYLAFACFVLALYVKQTAVAAPAACLTLALFERRSRALRLACFAILLGASPLAWLETTTHGLFLRNLITYNRNGFSINTMFSVWFMHLDQIVAVLATAFFLPILLLTRLWRTGPAQGSRPNPLRRNLFERSVAVTGTYLVFAAAVSTTVGKEGSNYNYFLEVNLAASLLCGLFLGWRLGQERLQFRSGFALVAMIVLPLFLLHSARNIRTLSIEARDYVHPANTRTAEAVQFLRGLRGPVYSENMTVLVQAGKEIPAEPAIVTQLTKMGIWDETLFVQQIEQGQFSAIVISGSLDNRVRFSPRVAHAVMERYEVRRTFGQLQIYQPRS